MLDVKLNTIGEYKIDKNNLLNKLSSLQNTDRGENTERLLAEILKPLFVREGYYQIEQFVEYRHSSNNSINEWDMIIKKDKDSQFHEDSIGVEVKAYKERKVGTDIVNQVLNKAKSCRLKRIFIFNKSGFTQEAINMASKYSTQQVELYDFDKLKSWVVSLDEENINLKKEIDFIIKSTSKKFIDMIAKNPRYLDSLEWRDLERLLAEAFEGVGFSVTLTPSSKDGGKDLILKYEVSGKLKTYIVEVKHWRAGSKVGNKSVESFLSVILNEKHEGGVFISTYGYTRNAFESLTKIQRERLKFGNEEKVVSLCKSYVRINNGFWSPELNIVDTLFQDTI
jgi:restriction endonuclease Mrr